jgi:3-keto-5-aminohexanoate cleavage enzyme
MKKIINFTPTGTQTNRENSRAPLLPNEIIEEVHHAYEMGITMVHIHARDPKDFSNTYKKDVYQPIIEGIRKNCPNLAICVSLTGRLHPEFEKRSEVLELKPDMGSLTMSSINFPKSASVNEPEMILKLIEKMNQYGVIPEIECFDSGMVNYTNYLIKKGILKGPHYMNIIFGNIYNAQIDTATLSSITNNLPPNTKVCFGGIGKDQLNSNILGLIYADGVRIGLEDNLYIKNKELTTNLELLSRMHKIMEQMELSILTPLEFKQLGYGNKRNNDIRI